nr:P protein-like isoform X2 [Parasteatoda tepidariorum]
MNVTGDATFKQELIHVMAKGPFIIDKDYPGSQDYVSFSVSKINCNGTYVKVSTPWILHVAENSRENEVEPVILEHDFQLKKNEISDCEIYQVSVSTNKRRDIVSLSVFLSVRPKLAMGRILMALCVLIGLYLLIIFEIVHRTLAAMIGATCAISCLAIVGERPSLAEVLTWVDVETLCLLFGMMVLVSILCETGFFDYIAVLTYKMARGRIWPLITGLCLVTAVLSAFLDNVTTVLLMSAVAIRLCETMNVDPKHMLISLVIFSNIGGAATPIGDPPNIIIINFKGIASNGINFTAFTLHMAPAVIICIGATYILMRIMYRNTAGLKFREPQDVVDMKHELTLWKKAAKLHSGYSKDEDAIRALLKRKMCVIESKLEMKTLKFNDPKISEADYRASLVELTNTLKIKDSVLLIKSLIVIGIVIILFFLESFPQLNLSLGWIAILGAIFLLVLGDFEELESILGRVEWSTLVFFAALFIVMEALSRLELVYYIVSTTQDIINSVDSEHRLLVAIVIILWTSALSSSLIDNIPFTTVMVQVICDISSNEKLPLFPLVLSLALGACFGGNGTLIGASANLVTAGVAEQHGYRFSFYDFFRIGFPTMILTTTLSTIYLVTCHIWIGWNY